MSKLKYFCDRIFLYFVLLRTTLKKVIIMQKLLKSTALLLIILLLMPLASFAANDTITLYINDKKINTDVPPEIRNGRTLVPVRVIFEYFDAKVYWNDTLKQVTVATKDKTIVLTVNSNTVIVNSSRYVLDTAPVIKEGRTLVPVRFISETLGNKVEWDEKTRSVKISSQGASAPPATTPSFKYNINSISVNTQKTEDVVTLKTTCDTSPSMMVYANPYRIILDFESTALKNGDGKITAESGFIKEIRYARHEDFSRVVIECKNTQPYKASFNSGTVTVKVGSKDTYVETTDPSDDEDKDDNNDINDDTSKDNPDNSSDEDSSDNSSDNNPDNTDTEEPKEEYDPYAKLKFMASRDENNILIILDAGHGGSDPGAIGYDKDGNAILNEKDVNLTVANKVAKLLTQKGIKFRQTRSTDKYLKLQEITEFANSFDADMFVSIHSNAMDDPNIYGTMVLYNGNGDDSYGIDGKTIASYIKEEIVKNVDVYDRGIISRPGLWVLRKTYMPAALVECAFVTNEGDRKLLMDEEVLDMFAKSIADGIEKSIDTMKENIIKAKKELAELKLSHPEAFEKSQSAQQTEE